MNYKIDIERIVLSEIYNFLKIPEDKKVSILNMSMQELNLDSLDFYEFIVNLEEKHKIYFPLDKFKNKLTILKFIKLAQLKEKY